MLPERRTGMSISGFPLQTYRVFKMLMIPYSEWILLNNDYYGMSFRVGFYTASCLASQKFNEDLGYWCRRDGEWLK